MASTLTLTFQTTPFIVADERLTIRFTTPSGNIDAIENFKAIRTRNYEVTIPSPYSEDDMALNFASAFNLDYIGLGGTQGLIVASSVNNVVTINLDIPSWNFDSVSGEVISGGAVIGVITNDPIEPEKIATITSYSTNATNKCTTSIVNIDAQGGNGIYNIFLDNVLALSGQTSPIALEVPRQQFPQTIKVVDTNGLEIAEIQTISTRSLIEDDVNIQIANFEIGATVTFIVNYISEDISSYEYSLDGVNYQTENVFTGQAQGNYTVYVRDGLGCVVTKDYVVDEFTSVSETIFDISKINPIRYAKVESGKKNQLNTLSYEELRLTPYVYRQKYLEGDVITTQFKTNAQYIRAYQIDSDSTEADLVVAKKTNNIGVKVKTTCTYLDLTNGRSGIYFGVVNELDYDTDAVIKELNYGNVLPQWASEAGQYVTISSLGTVQIDKISFNEELSSFVAEFPIAFSGSSERNVSSIYNIQPYEIYEFNTTISLDSVNLVIEVGTAIDSIDFCYVSECIKKVEDSEKLFKIEYWDDENIGNFNYQTEVQNLIRLEGYQDYVGDQSTEGYNGNEQYFVTDNEIYDMEVFDFVRLSSEMAHKVRLILAHKYLKINGLFYKLAEAPDISGDKFYNMKKVTVSLKQGGEEFLKQSQEVILDSPEQQQIGGAIESAKDKGILLWTKNV